ncbi:sigma-54 dependent transcriptional regulator [Cellvibrio sp. NN19]|uniref:sigma-54 interaction domain-containing protein n=1 Tax=Cellvibrio chitinivorans TaxID=3102792 RepID=UPI002B40151B|nr:sigma-54 dependent transcriptional regulator [Cellvibrio sp. NN19]
MISTNAAMKLSPVQSRDRFADERLFADRQPASNRRAARKVIIIGRPQDDFSGESTGHLLNESLELNGCQLIHCTGFGELSASLIASASMVFVYVSSFPGAGLFARVGALIADAPQLSIVPVVEYADQEKAAALLEMGCVDYLLAPFSASQLDMLLQRLESALAAEEIFVTRSRAGRRLLAMAQRVAMATAPILITGETGTGKEMMARYIHRFAHRSANAEDAPFIAVNCAAIPEQMLESLLFGHEKGAFTGATASQAGKFELANGGTLLLDEIGELPLGLQAKLLRVLQEQKVERLGGHKEIPLNVRIIAATNRDLQVEVAEGRFRSDLMFRLDVLPLHISPLRERKDDVLPLAQRLIRKHAPHEQRDDLLTQSACDALIAHNWPGNVRELENMLQRALVLRNGLFIQPQDLGLSAGTSEIVQLNAPINSEMNGEMSGKAALRASGKWAEYQHVIDTIRRFGGHKTKAAESLGMTPRALRYRLTAMREQGVQITF